MSCKNWPVGMALVALALSLSLGVIIARADEPEKKVPQTTCLVMDNVPIKRDIYLDYQGQRIYFCCHDCPEKFKKDPEKYLEKAEKRNVLLESVQKNCPVTGEPINKEFFCDYKGRRVYFCTAACVQMFQNDPKKYLKKIK